jgi:hypothetical protein
MDRRRDAYVALLGDPRLADLVLQVAAPFPDYHRRMNLEPPRRMKAWPAWNPLDKLPAPALLRLMLAGGLIIIRGWPWANNVPDELASACRMIFYFEWGNGFIPHPKGEPVAIPRFGWTIAGGMAMPVCPALFEYWEDDWGCCEPDRLGILDPFSGDLYDTAKQFGPRTPDRPHKAWHGTSFRYVTPMRGVLPISKKDQRKTKKHYKPTNWLVA